MNRFLRTALVLSMTIVTPVAALAQHRSGGAMGLGVGRAAPHAPFVFRAPPIAPPVRVAAPAARMRNVPMPGSPAQLRLVAPSPGIHFRNRALPGLRIGLLNRSDWDDWGWNGGWAWSPSPFDWGGAFWGPWPYGTTSSDMQYGAVTDTQANVTYASYEVGMSSPGAELLADYGLEQVQCGAANLVKIWGPYHSVVCARPNELVPAGNYEVDPATLTLRPLKKP